MRLFIVTFFISVGLNSPCALPAAAGGNHSDDDRIQRWQGPLGMNFVRVGAPGNAQDERDPGWRRFGAVDYVYWISETEVTNAMYTAFLNSVATDGDRLRLTALRHAGHCICRGLHLCGDGELNLLSAM